MNKSKQYVICVLSIICLFLMVGCASIERELDFKPSGLIGLKESCVLQEDLIKLGYNSVDDFYSQFDSQFSAGYYLNFKITKLKTKIKDADAYGYSIEGTTTENIAEYLLSANDLNFDIEHTGLFKKNIKITITSNKPQTNNNQNNQSSNQSIDEYFDNLSNQITNSVMNSISDKLVVKVHGKVLSTNGFEDENNPKSITWDLSDIEMGNTRSKELTVSYLNTSLIVTVLLFILLVILLIISLLIVLMFVIKGIKKHKNSDDTLLSEYISRFVKDGGKVVYNVYVPGVNNSVGRIDAVLIHDSGVYLFDRKKNKGWISGTESDDSWIVTTKNEEQLSIVNPVKQTLAQTDWLKKHIQSIVDVYSIIIFPEESNLISVSNSYPKIKVIKGNNYDGVLESFRAMRGIIFPREIDEIEEDLNKITNM